MSTTEVIDLTTNTQIVAGVKLSVGKARAMQIAETFQPLVDRASNAVGKYAGISVTKEDDVAGMKVARGARLALRQIRLEIEEAHKVQKEAAKVEGQCLDEIKRNALALIKPEEDRLQACEDFAKNAEVARKAALRAERAAALAQVEAITTGFVLEDLPEDRWLELLESETTKFHARKAAAAQAELDRQAKARADAEAAQKLRAENERLRAEQAEKDHAAAAERAEASRLANEARIAARVEQDRLATITRKEREAREKAQQFILDQEQAEAEKKAESERLARAAAAAPDAEKLRAFLRQLDDLYPGEASTDAGKVVFDALNRNIKKLHGWVIDKINELNEGEAA